MAHRQPITPPTPTDLPATSLFLSPSLLIGFPAHPLLSGLRDSRYRCLSYAITSQRVVLRSGILERVIEIVDLDQIVHADMDVHLTDILLGFGRTGSPPVHHEPSRCSGNLEEPPHILSHIPHPDDVLRFFHRAEFDEKTDIQASQRTPFQRESRATPTSDIPTAAADGRKCPRGSSPAVSRLRGSCRAAT